MKIRWVFEIIITQNCHVLRNATDTEFVGINYMVRLFKIHRFTVRPMYDFVVGHANWPDSLPYWYRLFWLHVLWNYNHLGYIQDESMLNLEDPNRDPVELRLGGTYPGGFVYWMITMLTLPDLTRGTKGRGTDHLHPVPILHWVFRPKFNMEQAYGFILEARLLGLID